MSNKPLHIVFQVLNFITSPDSDPYQLTHDEEKLLLILAKHKGPKGIYPSIPTLAEKSKRTERSVMRTLVRLEEKHLIMVNRQQGKSNHYEIAELSTTPDVHVTPDMYDTPDVHVTTPLTSMAQTPDVHVTRSNKIIKTDNQNRERRKNRAHPLPDDYLHTELHEEKAQEFGWPADEFFECLDKFMAHHRAKGTEKVDWDAEFDLWLIREERFKAEETAKRERRANDRSLGNGSGRGQQEVRSTVPWFNGRDPLAVGTILDKGLLNGHGRKN